MKTIEEFMSISGSQGVTLGLHLFASSCGKYVARLWISIECLSFEWEGQIQAWDTKSEAESGFEAIVAKLKGA